MRTALTRCGLILLVLLQARTANAGLQMLQCASSGKVEKAAPLGASAPLRLQLAPGTPRAWLEIDEDGRALQLDTAAVVLDAPPRLARHGLWLEAGGSGVLVSDKAAPDAPLRLQARLHCDQAGQRAALLQSLAAIAQDIAPGRVGNDALPALLARLAAFPAEGDSQLRAYTVHLAAQASLLAGRSAEAAARFRDAEQTWRDTGDLPRALAARAAWVEETYALGQYDAVLGATRELPETGGSGTAYYQSRLRNARCLGLKYLGRYDEALDCYTGLTSQLVHMAEPLDLANALLNLGNLQRDRGQLEAARDSAETARKVASSAEIQRMPEVDVAGARGRTRLLLADLALRRGAVTAAVEEYDAALADFDRAKAPRWRANTLLQLAALYGRLGIPGDAYAMWSRGVSLYDFHAAPARIASAMLSLALIQRDDGNPRYAAWLAAGAAQRFAALGMPVEQESARIVQVRALLDAGDIEAAARQLPPLPGRNATDLQLAVSALALSRHQPVEALATLDATMPDSLAEQLDRELQRASAWQALGDDERALRHADAALWQVDRITMASANTLLRQLLQRHSEPLRRRTLSWRLAQPPTPAGLDALIRSLPHVPLPEAQTTPQGRSPVRPGAVDASLARDMLLGQGQSLSNPALPALLVQPDALAFSAGIAPSLPQLQSQLPPGTALFALLNGSDRAAALWITATGVQLTPLQPPALLQESAQRLAEDLANPSTPVYRIESHARALRNAVWPGRLPAGTQRILVLADAFTDSIAWSVLPDDNGLALMESTDLSLVHLGASEAAPASPRLTLALATQSGRSSPLAPLDAAENEPRLIAAAYPALPQEMLDVSTNAMKPALVAALSKRGSWLHISAHGMTDSGYLGRSGVWLDDTSGRGLPQFFSVLDLFDARIRAQLVVLNACDLGGGGGDGVLAFADTLARLGAQHVIAALRPVSDNAAMLWVPAFYAALATSPHLDPAAALRRGQQKLAHSRAFRHPFYWASLVHIRRLELMPTTQAQEQD